MGYQLTLAKYGIKYTRFVRLEGIMWNWE